MVEKAPSLQLQENNVNEEAPLSEQNSEVQESLKSAKDEKKYQIPTLEEPMVLSGFLWKKRDYFAVMSFNFVQFCIAHSLSIRRVGGRDGLFSNKIHVISTTT